MTTTQAGKNSPLPAKEKTRQNLRTGLVIGAMIVLCGGFLWMLYAPKQEQKSSEMLDGFDTSIPDATVGEVQTDKRKVYEEIHRQELWQDKVRSLESLADDSLLSDSVMGKGAQTVPIPEENAINTSHDTYRTLNRQVTTFYQPAFTEDTRVEALQEQVEELTRRLEQQQTLPSERPSAEALMERSYALAARYFPQGTAGSVSQQTEIQTPEARIRTAEQVAVVRRHASVASSLAVPDTLQDVPRNRTFSTAVEPDTAAPTGMIRACIAGEQRIASGERVRLRLLDPVQAGNAILPEGTIIYGTASISGQRLGIEIRSLATGTEMLAVHLTAYDTDGLQGLFIPDTAERTALKNAAASMGNNLSSGITITRSAGQQIASDLTRSLLSGGMQYLSGKMREVRVTLKTGYNLFLVSKQ